MLCPTLSVYIYIFTCTVFVSLSIFDSLSVCLSICKLISLPLCLPVSLSCSFSIALCPFPCLRLITLLLRSILVALTLSLILFVSVSHPFFYLHHFPAPSVSVPMLFCLPPYPIFSQPLCLYTSCIYLYCLYFASVQFPLVT